MLIFLIFFFFFFFNDTATTEIYTLSLHDALPISSQVVGEVADHRLFPGAFLKLFRQGVPDVHFLAVPVGKWTSRSEEHTSELQSRSDLVCRLLLEKKKK